MKKLLLSFRISVLAVILTSIFLSPAARAADLSALSFDDRESIQMACALERSSGPVAYNNCVGQQLHSLQASFTAQPVQSSSAKAPIANKSSPVPVAQALPSTAYPPAYSPTYPAPACAENGSCYGDISAITGLPKTISVPGYFRANGTYVRGYYRSR